jgi:uncharacterized membrane protein
MNVFVAFALTLGSAIAATLVATILMPRFWHRPLALSYRVADIAFLALALAYVLVFGALAILRHNSFHSGGYDLGIFDQVVWNSLHGRLFENSIMIDSPSFLGHHFSPILLALVPIYAVWSDARALLAVQTLALALAAFPIYWFARKQLGAVLALALAGTYFLYPSTQYVNLFEFHEIALATPLLAFALFFLLRKRTTPFFVCWVLTLLVKEEIAFITVAFGLFLLFVQRKRALGLALTVFGTVWAVVVLQYVIPFFYGTAYGEKYYFVERYLYLGNTVSEIVTTAITQPGLVLQHLLVPAKIEFVLQLLIPLAFIPLIGAEVAALALPTLGYLLLGDNAFQNSIRFQYTALLIPFIFFATAVGLKRLRHTRAVALATLLLVGSLVNYYFQAAGPLARQFDLSQYAVTPHVQLGRQLLNQIPPDAPVMADSNLVPHLSDRQFVYQASVVPDLRKIEYLLADTTLPIHAEYKWIWDDVLPLPFFETVAEQDGYILKKRSAHVPTHPLAIQFDNRIRLLGYTIESNLPARRGDTVSIVLVWRADQAIHERYVIFVHLLGAEEYIWAQDDREPGMGWFRTDRWNVGDVTPDRYALELPAMMPPGEYQITAGLYTTTDQKNLTARDPSGKPLGSEPALGILRVVAGTP